MSSDNTREIYRRLATSQQQYTFFLLAAAGAAIALAVNQTATATLGYDQIPLGLAVLCWALSFYSGCTHLHYGHAFLHTNAELHKVAAGNHPMAGNDPERMQIGRETLRDILEKQSNKQHLYGVGQFVLLVAGGVFYVVWHIFEMYMRTVIAAVPTPAT